MITYTYKTKLNAHTHRNLAEFLTQQRLLYNGALQERIDCYQKTGKSISLFDQRGSLTTIRQTDEWFRKFDRWCQDSALVRVDRAFKRFFRQGRGFPRFKSAKRGVMSFETFHKKPIFDGKYGSVKIKGIGRFRWRQDSRCGDCDTVKLVRVVQRPTGVFIQLVCDVEIQRIGLNRAIGIDVGVHVNAALSDGTVISRHTPGPIRDPSQATSLESLRTGFSSTRETTADAGTGLLSGTRPASQRYSSSYQRDRRAPR